MENHLLEYIEIKDFKCFKDFKSEGFKRVNLIGGKNNVGKTAFMEACCANIYAQSINNLTQSLFSIAFLRDKKNKINISKKLNVKEIIERLEGISINSNINQCSFNIKEENGIKKYIISINNNIIEVNVNEFSFSTERVSNINFIDSVGFSYETIKDNYISMQMIDKEPLLNDILKKFDIRLESFKIIDGKAVCKVDGEYSEINEMGDGVSRLVSIVSALFHSKDGYLFIDEIENGFHYTFLDSLWEIILNISKEQKVQVFATTHSKECIDSYARVSKKLEDKNISFVALGRNKKNELKSLLLDFEMFQTEILQDHEVRGW